MNTIISPIALSISVLAFIFSVFSWLERKRQDRRDLFLKINERLAEIDLQRGRRILYRDVNSKEDAKTLFDQRPDDYDLANMALAMLDIAALYVEQRYIDRRLFMNQWGLAYARLRENSCYFINERAARSTVPVPQPWPHFQRFVAQATQHFRTDDGSAVEGGE